MPFRIPFNLLHIFLFILQDSKQANKIQHHTTKHNLPTSAIKPEEKNINHQHTERQQQVINTNKFADKKRSSIPDVNSNHAATSSSYSAQTLQVNNDTEQEREESVEEEEWMDNSSEIVSDDSDINESDIEVD